MNGGGMDPPMEREYIRRHHRHESRDNQCSCALVKHIKAPVPLVWSLVRKFDEPQRYKPFVSRCIVRARPRVPCCWNPQALTHMWGDFISLLFLFLFLLSR